MKWILTILLTTSVWALPEKVEFWFLSEKKSTASLIDNLNEFSSLGYFTQTKTHIGKGCQPMGDKFFHPQYGVHNHEGDIEGIFTEPVSDKKKKAERAQKIHDMTKELNSDMINCDENYYFDMFCGEAKAQAPINPPVEVWIDISTSLRSVDFDKNDQCYRRQFAQKLMSNCESKVSVSVFDTSLKQVSDTSKTCLNHGLNDQKRLIDWVRRNKSKHLIIVTDITEYDYKLSAFMDEIGAISHGEKTGQEMIASELLTRISGLEKSCKKL